METVKNLEIALNKVKVGKGLKNLLDATKKANKSLFKVHKELLSLYIHDNKKYFNDTSIFEKKKINPQITLIKKDKKFNPFALLFGTLSLDKVLKAFNTNDYFSFIDLYNKAIFVYIDSNKETQQNILLRGEKLNKLSIGFKAEEVSGLNFAKSLFEFFPSFYDGVKSNKIAPNVAKFLFENDYETYETLNIKDLYDVEHENLRAEVRKNKGIEGLEAFDAEYEAKKATVNIKRTKATTTKAKATANKVKAIDATAN